MHAFIYFSLSMITHASLPQSNGMLSGGSFSDIIKHFDRLSPEEREQQLRKLLQRYDNHFDIIGHLPFDLAGLVFSFCTPKSLCTYRLVSRNWNRKVTQDYVWKVKCEEYSMIPATFGAEFTFESSVPIFYDIFRRSMTVIKNWQSLTRTKKYELRFHQGPILCMLMTHLTRLFTGGVDGIIHVWDAQNYTKVTELKAHRKHVSCLAHYRNTLASGSSDKEISIYRIDTLKLLKKLKGHTEPVTSLAFSTLEEDILFSGSVDKTIRIWDINEGQCMRVLQGQENTISSLVYCPFVPATCCGSDLEAEMVASNTAGYLISGSSAQTVFLWDLKTSAMQDVPEVVCAIMETNGPVTALALFDELDGSHVLNKTKDIPGVPRTYLKNHYVYARRQLGVPTFIAVAGSLDYSLTLFSVPGLDKTYIEAPVVHKGTIWSISAAPIHSKIVTASGDRTVVVWDLKEGLSSQTLGGFDSAVICSAIPPQEEAICFGTEKGTIYIFDLQEFI